MEASEDTIGITVSLNQLMPDRHYNVHLHRGDCRTGAGGGKQLNPIKSSEKGQGESFSVVNINQINPTFNHLIMVHDPSGHHVVCADLPPLRGQNSRLESPDK